MLGTDYAGVLVRDGWRCTGATGVCTKLCQSPASALAGAGAETPLQPLEFEGQGRSPDRRRRAGPLPERRTDPARSRLAPRPARGPARSVDRRAAAVEGRQALRQASRRRIPGRVPLPERPLDRRHQLAGRTGHPPAVVIRKVCGGNRNGTRSTAKARARAPTHPTGALDRSTYRPSAPPRPTDADGRDIARPRARRPRRLRAPAAARVGGCRTHSRFETRPFRRVPRTTDISLFHGNSSPCRPCNRIPAW